MWCMLTVGGTGCGCFPHGAHSTFSGKVCKHAPATTTTTPPNTTPTTTTIAATTPTTTTGSASATPPTTVAGPLVEHEVRREQRIRDINRFLQSLSLGPLGSPPPPQAKPKCRQMESPPQLPTRATPPRQAKRCPRHVWRCFAIVASQRAVTTACSAMAAGSGCTGGAIMTHPSPLPPLGRSFAKIVCGGL